MRRYIVKTTVESYGNVEFVNYVAALDSESARFAVMDVFNRMDLVVDGCEATEITAFPGEVPVLNAIS